MMKRAGTPLSLWLLLVLSVWLSAARAQPSSTAASGPLSPVVEAVDAVGMTVTDMERALAFYTHVLSFEPVSDVEVWGTDYEQLLGVFGLRMRVVRLRL